MLSSLKNISLLFSLVLFVYVMRQDLVSPGNFLRHQAVRFIQEQQLLDRFCSNGQDSISFSTEETERATSLRSSLSNIRDDDSLTAFIQRNDPNEELKEYAKSLIPFLVPWVVFFGLSILGCLFCLINWCCMNCACLKHRCCSICHSPKSGRFKNCYAIVSLLFMMLAVGAGIAGIIFSANFPKYADATICSTIKFIQKIEDGSEEDKWIGAKPAIDKIDDLVSKMERIISSLNVYNLMSQDFQSDLNVISDSLGSVKDASLNRINPNERTPYKPYYIQALEPIGNYLSETKNSVESNLQNMETDVKKDTNQIISDIENNKPILEDTSDKISDALNKISDNQSSIQTIIDIVGGVLLGLFIANVAISGLAILSILCVCFGSKFFNKLIHLSWCTLGLLLIVGWAVSTALYGVNIIVSEACDVGNGIRQDPLFFNQTFDKLASILDMKSGDLEDTRKILFRCMHLDGDLSTEFNLKKNLDLFPQLYEKINDISSKSDQFISDLRNPLINNQEENLKAYLNNDIPDSKETLEDMDTLNFYTTSSTENSCPLVNDHWVLSSKNCTADMGTRFQNQSPDDFNVPNPTCIGYNVWNENQNDISNRYAQALFSGSGCNGNNNAAFVINYIRSLDSNRAQSKELIQKLEEELSKMEEEYTNFRLKLPFIKGNLTSTNSSIIGIYDFLTNEDNGLILNTNCTFIAKSFEDLTTVACTGLGTTIFGLSLTYLVLSFVLMFGNLALFCLAKRFTVNDKMESVKPLSSLK